MSIVESTAARDNLAPGSRPRVLAVEFETEGHHPGWVDHFAKAWLNEKIQADLEFLVTPTFFERHADVVEFVNGLNPKGIRIHSITADEEQRMEKISRLRYFPGWNLYCKYAKALNADHGLIMYSDFFQLPSVVGNKSPCPFSMIYFRPTFHYPEFRSYRSSFGETLRGWRKKLLLKQVLKNPQLNVLYCLDEIAAEHINENLQPACHVQRFADTFTTYETSPERITELRQRLAIEPERRVLMLLGVLDRRKGVIELLQALREIPAAAAAKLCLLLVGKVQESHRDEVLSLIAKVQDELAIQIVLRNEYIPADEVQLHFDVADVILTTYQGHMGSSLALIRAAYAGKPVLSSDYGLMGELVLRRKLGETVDTGDPAAMTRALERFATDDLTSTFDPVASAAFAQENTPEQLGRDLAMMLKYIPAS